MKKFLYIDDESTDSIQAFVESVEESNVCSIKLEQPNAFEKTASRIITSMEAGEFDGLILDWMLNDNPVANTGIPVRYKAAELAQLIRREIVEHKCKADFPIFIWSLEERLMTSFYKDDTSHDLFDAIYLKSSHDSIDLTIDNSPDIVRKQIISFSNSYSYLSQLFYKKHNSSEAIVQALGNTDVELDKRIVFHFNDTPYEFNVHSHIHFIYREILLKPGVLISEELLAARLGINIPNSSDWNTILDNLKTYKYTGIFSEILDRWWMDGINEWWHNTLEQKRPLSSTNALNRVNILKKALNLDGLVDAQPIQGLTKNFFWHLCAGYKLPVDIDDAFLINENSMYPWQDRGYISIAAIQNRVGYPKRVAIHPLELSRLQDILA